MEYIEININQALKMRTLYNSAYKLYNRPGGARLKETIEVSEVIRKQIHDLLQRMIRVVLPGFNLPDDYAFPLFYYVKPRNWEQYKEAQNIFYGHSRWGKNITEKPTKDNVDELAKLAEEYSTPNTEEKEKYYKKKFEEWLHRAFELSAGQPHHAFPDFEKGWGFTMEFRADQTENEKTITVSYPACDIDIAKTIAEYWKEHSHTTIHE